MIDNNFIFVAIQKSSMKIISEIFLDEYKHYFPKEI
jgi:hypothetical protein